ncbi:MAG: hypothetical protein ACRD96_08925, partial [Bryobacteraceae bacterium]
FTIAPPPVLANGAVVNAASQSPEISAGGLVSIHGRQLAPSESQALRVPLPRTLGGVVVRFNGRDLPLLFTSPTQVNAQLPFDALGPGTLEVATENGAAGVPVFVAEVAPAIFSVPAEGNVVPAVVHANGQIVTPEFPATPGEHLVVYMTGLGRTVEPLEAGDAAPRASRNAVTVPVSVDIGDSVITPSFAGLAPGAVGQYQVEFTLPEDARSGAVPLRVLAEGVASNQVLLAVR